MGRDTGDRQRFHPPSQQVPTGKGCRSGPGWVAQGAHDQGLHGTDRLNTAVAACRRLDASNHRRSAGPVLK